MLYVSHQSRDRRPRRARVRISCLYLLSNRVLAGEEATSKAFTDDHNRRGGLCVLLCEVPTPQQGYSHSAEIVIIRKSEIGKRGVILVCWRWPAFNSELVNLLRPAQR